MQNDLVRLAMSQRQWMLGSRGTTILEEYAVTDADSVSDSGLDLDEDGEDGGGDGNGPRLADLPDFSISRVGGETWGTMYN
jgi:hypothetical protein